MLTLCWDSYPRYSVMLSYAIWLLVLRACDGLQVDYYDDPEEERLVKYPSTAYGFTQSDLSRYLPSEVGNLFAGRAEFPWLVDIRAIGDEDQTAWAPGNLLTSRHIMATCRYVKYLELYTADPDKRLSSLIYPKEVKVMFASSYLWEDHDAVIQIKSWPRPEDVPTIYTTGSRLVRLMVPHPGCDDNPIEYDVGLLELVEYIFPVPPYINYMPFGFSKSKMKLTNYNARLQVYKNITCFVASFGRNWANWRNHFAVDYKVKYRMYFTKWSDCYSMYQRGYYSCSTPDDQNNLMLRSPCLGNFVQPGVTKRRVQAGWAQAKCATTRAPVGTVCDHDQGAPVVCNNEVIGIVIRGASAAYCNNLYPVPFVVLKITAAADYFIDMVKAPYRYPPLLQDRPFSLEFWTGLSAASLRHLPPITVLLFIASAVFSRIWISPILISH